MPGVAERASVFQGIQLGLETTPGVLVPSTKLLQSMSLVPQIDLTVDTFRPMGNKYITVAAPGKEIATVQVQGKLTYTEIVYVLSSLFGAATITGTGAPYSWVFNPASTAPDVFQTYTVQQGNVVRAESWTYGLFTGMTITGSRDGFDLRGTMMGQAITDGVTMTATPTSIPLIPVLGKEVSVFYNTTSATIGTTQLGRLLSLELSYTGKFLPLWVLDGTQPSFVAMVETAPTPTIKLLVEANALGMALLNEARSGASAYVRIVATSGTGTNTLTFDMACKHTKPDAYTDSSGVFAVGFNLHLAHDSAWGTGKSLVVTATNALAGL